MAISLVVVFLSVFYFSLNLDFSLAKFALFDNNYTPINVADKQLEFWSQNVQNKMPKTLMSRLSNLTTAQSAYFSTMVSKQAKPLNSKFCSLAGLVCGSNMHIECLGFWFIYDNSSVLPVEHSDEHSFFRLSKLEEGKKIYLSNLTDMYPHRNFLPNEIASKISINLVELKRLFPQLFSRQKTKDTIQRTLSYCNARALKGETKGCQTSLEGMIRFSKDSLDKNRLLVMSSESEKGSGQEVVISSITRFDTEKVVTCHEVFLPFSTYFCHLFSSTRIYAVDVVEQKTGSCLNKVLVVCHMDTSAWPKNHLAFQLINSSPGQAEACHWMNQNDIVFLGEGNHI